MRRIRVGSGAGRELGAECQRHRDALLGLLVVPPGTELTASPGSARNARDHFDACDHCRAEIPGLVLTGFAVQRTFSGATRAEPSDDAWLRLRRRLERPPQRVPAFASSVAGLILAAGMASMLVIPLAMPAGTSGPGGREALEPAIATEYPGGSMDAGRPDSTVLVPSPTASAPIGKETRSRDRSRAWAELMRYELAPQGDVHLPPQRSRAATVL
jgi:hypothetical protein